MIHTHNLTKQYGAKVAIDRLNLDIHDGELFALLGVNGAGKTTTIKLLSCLTTPSAGSAAVCGFDILHERIHVKERIALSPQQTAVAPNLNVRENLELIYGLYGHKPSACREKATEIIAEFDLNSVASQRAKTLSGGWHNVGFPLQWH